MAEQINLPQIFGMKNSQKYVSCHENPVFSIPNEDPVSSVSWTPYGSMLGSGTRPGLKPWRSMVLETVGLGLRRVDGSMAHG